MGESQIEWVASDDGTPGKTWNPIRGCTRVSEGCRHCYAERVAARGRRSGRLARRPFMRQWSISDILVLPDFSPAV